MQTMDLPPKDNSPHFYRNLLFRHKTLPQTKLPRSPELRLSRLGRVDRNRAERGACRPARAPAARD